MATTSNDQPAGTTSPKRGRKKGSTLHPEDHGILLQVARLVNTGQADTPGKVFTEFANGDTNALRRWHRKWKAHPGFYLKEERRIANGRYDLEYRSLRESAPALWGRIKNFERSTVGQEFLRGRGRGNDEVAHPISLPIWTLMKEVTAYEEALVVSKGQNDDGETGSSSLDYEGADTSPPAPTRFDSAVAAWLDKNVPVSLGAMRELADMATTLADQLEAASKKEASQ